MMMMRTVMVMMMMTTITVYEVWGLVVFWSFEWYIVAFPLKAFP